MTTSRFSALAVYSNFSAQPGGPYLWAVKVHGELFRQLTEAFKGRDARSNARDPGHDFETRVEPGGIVEYWADAEAQQDEMEFVLLDESSMPGVKEDDWRRFNERLAADYQHREVLVVPVEVQIADIGLYKAHVGMEPQPLTEFLGIKAV